MTYEVLVEFTDRQVVDGAFKTYPSTVTVTADSDTEATLIAAQMVAAIRCDLSGMVVATTITNLIL